ncbi:hypothetical protein EF914_29595 [Streptomyces sp. WAC05458]|nr:hypothetical protein EF914_29595 [Streptomyces sp. WAC05458]
MPEPVFRRTRSTSSRSSRCSSTRSTATPLQGDYALAMTTYNRIAAELTGVTGQGQTIRIILDDGLPHEAGD